MRIRGNDIFRLLGEICTTEKQKKQAQSNNGVVSPSPRAIQSRVVAVYFQ